MARFKGIDWDLEKSTSGSAASWQMAQMAVLMDIRDELQTLNRLLGCPNFVDVPNRLFKIGMHTDQARNLLETIRKNTTKRRRRRTKKA